MKLRRVELSGFRGIRDQMSIAVPSGFLVVTGRNGAGKSTVCDAVEFAVAGRLRRQEGQSERNERIEDYLWWRGVGVDTDRYVRCLFQLEDGQEVLLERTPSTSPGEISPEARTALTETQVAPRDALEQLMVSCMIRDEDITRLSIDLAEAERFRFVREAIGDRQLTALAARMHAARTVLNERHEAAKNRYEKVRGQLNQGLERLSELRAAVVSEKQLAEARRELTEILGSEADDLEAARTRSAEWGEAAGSAMNIARRLASLDDEMNAVSEAHPDDDELLASVTGSEDALTELRRELDELEAAVVASRSAGDVERVFATLLEAGTRVGRSEGRCPLCGSQVSAEQFHEHIVSSKEALRADAARIAQLEIHRDNLQAAIYQEEKRLRTVRQDVAGRNRRREEIETERRELRSRATEALATVARTEPLTVEVEDLLRFARVREEQASRIGRLVRLLESARIVNQVEATSATVGRTREEADRLAREMERAQQSLARATSIRASLRRLEGEVIEERLSAIGPLLEEIYLRLRPHTDWTNLSYHIRGDVKRFLSLQIGDGLNPKFMFSSGQRRAIGIAFLLSVYLSTGWSKLRTLFLDDPVQHIDDYRALHLVELLAAIGRTSRQIVCTVEDPALAELVARRLQGVTPGPGALIELEYIPGAGSRIATEQQFPAEGEGMLLMA